jgi:hypothetical protein
MQETMIVEMEKEQEERSSSSSFFPPSFCFHVNLLFLQSATRQPSKREATFSSPTRTTLAELGDRIIRTRSRAKRRKTSRKIRISRWTLSETG